MFGAALEKVLAIQIFAWRPFGVLPHIWMPASLAKVKEAIW